MGVGLRLLGVRLEEVKSSFVNGHFFSKRGEVLCACVGLWRIVGLDNVAIICRDIPYLAYINHNAAPCSNSNSRACYLSTY